MPNPTSLRDLVYLADPERDDPFTDPVYDFGAGRRYFYDHPVDLLAHIPPRFGWADEIDLPGEG